MKELCAITEIGMLEMQDKGLNAYREAIQFDLLMKIKQELADNLDKFVMIERRTDPLTGVMYAKASLRLLEPSDGQMMRFAYVPFEDEQMRLR